MIKSAKKPQETMRSKPKPLHEVIEPPPPTPPKKTWWQRFLDRIASHP